ncbi:MAG: hypothetical protein U5L11_05045 [Arhodomonas sp.]|nr:hypothetical protein [Arhodomonas sp.]
MRLRAFKACQRLLAGREAVAILFDDCDDALAAAPMIAVDGGEEEGTSAAGSKAWINELLESNTIPCIWVANDLGWVDAAHLRRFDYPLFFRSVPPAVRRRHRRIPHGGAGPAQVRARPRGGQRAQHAGRHRQGGAGGRAHRGQGGRGGERIASDLAVARWAPGPGGTPRHRALRHGAAQRQP